MPQKLTVSDYTFLFVPLKNGKYVWKGRRGTINRKPNEEFEKLKERIGEPGGTNVFDILYGIADVEIFETGEHILVYDIFEDLRDGD